VKLSLDDDALASCVQCGLCLPACPTWRVTGDESASPRGRIAAMRNVQWEGAPADEDFVDFMDRCVLCRACEPACPAGVPFGDLMEETRETLADERQGYRRWWERLAFRVLGHHRLLLALSTLLAVAQRLRLVPDSVALPRLPLRRGRLVASGRDVYLFTGCVMDAWMRPTHAAAQRVIERTGTGVAFAGRGGDCCGALHLHAGLGRDARASARRVMASMPGDAPVVVDSAGCGAVMKEYGKLLGTPAAEAFSARVRDVHEWLAEPADRLPPPARRLAGRVAVQDPCHLRNVQAAHQHVRTVLAPYAEVVELDDDGLCCGAGGAYSAQHPELAAAIRDRKVEAVRRSGADVVASANPGCALHLAAAGLAVRHPVELIDEALGPSGPLSGKSWGPSGPLSGK
jgi:glycolate oxidase iron-sulfur subunit